ncbi:hypothetical protein M0802_000491 [Mischocyttarus mexicanus]|nr:hypothetical protein M0802_000491 [Mischocyttarus mexicanus]
MSRYRCWGATSYGLFLPLALFFAKKEKELSSASRVATLLLDGGLLVWQCGIEHEKKNDIDGGTAKGQ